jgi:pteridine reductase
MKTERRGEESAMGVALVTGSGRRLGAAVAVALARGGYDVAIHYNASQERARQTEARIAGARRRAVSFQADLRKPEEIRRLFKGVERHFGRLDCLVNSAAIFPLAPWEELTPRIWNDVLTVNLTAPFLCVKAAEPLLRAGGGGNVVNILSLGAFEAWIDRPANGVAKAGLFKLTQSLARALAPHILVNAVAPGTIDMPNEPAEFPPPPPGKIPLRRWGTPEDVGEAVMFLARTRYITGQCIVVDGGKLLT